MNMQIWTPQYDDSGAEILDDYLEPLYEEDAVTSLNILEDEEVTSDNGAFMEALDEELAEFEWGDIGRSYNE